MTESLIDRIHGELSRHPHIDPHSHIEPKAAAARGLEDILGYHYFTELAHSAGVPREQIEGEGVPAEPRLDAVVGGLSKFSNTVQHSWLLKIARDLFGFEHAAVTLENWRELDASIRRLTADASWENRVLAESRIEAVFLTNDFDGGEELRLEYPGYGTEFYAYNESSPTGWRRGPLRGPRPALLR